MREALSRFRGEGEHAQLLALLSLAIWITWNGARAPTAKELGAVHPTKESWVSAVYDVWPSLSGGRELSAEFLSASVSFWSHIRELKNREQRSLAASMISAKDALKQLKKRVAPVINFESLHMVPIEVRPARAKWVHDTKMIQPKQSNIKGLTDKEAYLLWICQQSNSLSKHASIIKHQTDVAPSEFFPETWKNLLGNPTVAKVNALLHAWKRWKKHVIRCTSQWTGSTLVQALFQPTAGALAHYAGERSLGGVTAARGALATLWRLAAVMGWSFPFAESGVNGWNTRLRDHIVQPKIPFEVAQLVHFDRLAHETDNPFILAICASVWFAFLGMCRDAHIQRSFLVKSCDHAWIFHCVKGKDKGKPYDWVLPHRTFSGSKVAHKIMSVVRKNQLKGEKPFLLRQWHPCTTNPLTGEYWREVPLSPTQLKLARQFLMRLPPLNSKIDLDCCSYAARRAGAGILALLNATSLLRNAFGNWRDATEIKKQGSDMPNNYTEPKLQVSFAAKYLVAESVRRTISLTGSLNFEWGEVGRVMDQQPEILKEARAKALDIVTDDRRSDFAKQGLQIDISAEEYLHPDGHEKRRVRLSVLAGESTTPSGDGLPEDDDLKVIKDSDLVIDEKDAKEEAEAESDSSSSSDSEADEAEDASFEEFMKYEEMEMVAGKTETSRIHQKAKKDNGVSEKVSTVCGAGPRRITAITSRPAPSEATRVTFAITAWQNGHWKLRNACLTSYPAVSDVG